MPHAYRALVEGEMTRRGWNSTQVASHSGLSKQLVSQIVNDERESLRMMPHRATVTSLADAFGIPANVIWVSIAQAMGLPIDTVPSVVREVETASDDELINELRRRLIQKEGSGHVASLAEKMDERRRKLSEPDETVAPAALDTDEGVDQRPGESPQE